MISEAVKKYNEGNLRGALACCILRQISPKFQYELDLSLNVLILLKNIHDDTERAKKKTSDHLGRQNFESVDKIKCADDLVDYALDYSLQSNRKIFKVKVINYKTLAFLTINLLVNRKFSFRINDILEAEFKNIVEILNFEASAVIKNTDQKLRSVKRLMGVLSEIKHKIFEEHIDTREYAADIFFNENFYFNTYVDARASGMSAWRHFNDIGWRLGYSPSCYFFTANYLNLNPDIRDGGINPLEHYVKNGLSEERVSFVTDGFVVDSKAIYSISEDFDEIYYRSQLSETDKDEDNPLNHYLTIGWRYGLNPSRNFNTKFYMQSNPDIAHAGINPYLHYLLHGVYEKRSAENYYKLDSNFDPLVTVIVPNFNHEKFLGQRLASIIDQTYTNIEIIFLDDCSQDESLAVAESILSDSAVPWQIVINEKNSGSVFAQWEKGLKRARGELIWICESDDFCESNFLEILVPHFRQKSVMMSVAKIQFADADGVMFDGMDNFRESAESGIWESPLDRTASEWFKGAFGVRNIVSNVGGCLFRNVNLSEEIWDRAKQLKIVGDWFLYVNIIGGGRLVYDPRTAAYFRQHKKNTSASNFNKMYFYEECMSVLELIAKSWGLSDEAKIRFWNNICYEYNHFGMTQTHGDFENAFPKSRYLNISKSQRHILVAFLGFSPGGGELLPINLANGLIDSGYFVSMFALSMANINDDMLHRLDRRIPIYSVGDVLEGGPNDFITRAGVDLVHSHMISCDAKLLLSENGVKSVPYIVSLHGSYDDVNLNPDYMPGSVLPFVSKWVYTADKNLKPFRALGFDITKMVKIPNGMPSDNRQFPKSRQEMGISEDAIVFTLVARGIKQKGWRSAVNAFNALVAENADINAFLIMVGEGYFTDDEVDKICASNSRILFLGYQSCINGIYRLSDCAIVPTRFDGESAPLCIIQALQEGTPVIATDIGEIKFMLQSSEGTAGIMLKNVRNTEVFINSLKAAMLEMCQKDKRMLLGKRASVIKNKHSIQAMTEAYTNLYEIEIESYGG